MSLENQDISITESFWEPKNYRRTTKRIDDGHKLCFDLIQMVQDRAEIEKNYASRLKTWSNKWGESLEKGPEYGTTESAWKSFLTEAAQLSDLHSQIKDSLNDKIITEIRNWQQENYHKKFLSLKECKDMEESFKKVQKPWEKFLTKVNKAKQDYHNACKAEQAALTQVRNAENIKGASPEVSKIRDRAAKITEEVVKSREIYEDAIAEIAKYNPKYTQEMKEVFDSCQEMEAKRLKFFKQTMLNIQSCVNISGKQELTSIYEEFHHRIEQANSAEDLAWWSNNFGADMPIITPIFEDYPDDYKRQAGSEGKVIDETEVKGVIEDKAQSSFSSSVPLENSFQQPDPDNSQCSDNVVDATVEGNPFESADEPQGVKIADIASPNPFEEDDNSSLPVNNQCEKSDQNSCGPKPVVSPKLDAEESGHGNPFEEGESK
ncbi:unnamed protein product [Allacma fusca]|uniref:F-BAR domain-containing protein n=1 Tax=Allacma fusca TaxID=39272 RepID=A0A8J2KGB8_9HEXA|nr:unnamed protein product [Allacma fusca]